MKEETFPSQEKTKYDLAVFPSQEKTKYDLAVKGETFPSQEKTKYDLAVKDEKQTLADIDAAVAALEKGMGKSFLQTTAADYLRKILSIGSPLLDKLSLDVNDQKTVLSFLQKDYSASGGEIVGILR